MLHMLLNLLDQEDRLNALLPTKRPTVAPSHALLAAAAGWSQAVWEAALLQAPFLLTQDMLNSGFALLAQPVFVCGVHRSGTTLVRDLLDGHEALVVLPSEGTYFTNLESKLLGMPAGDRTAFLCKEWLQRLANPINQPPYWLLGRSTPTESPYINFAGYFLAWWAVLNNSTNTLWPHMAVVLAYASCTGKLCAGMWVDKTPCNERFLNRIWLEMPNAKIIHVVRDPVATFASRKSMEPGFDLRRVLRELKKSLQVATDYRLQNDQRFLLVQYENACENPNKTAGDIAAFLRIQVLPSLTIPTVASMPAVANSSFINAAAAGRILKLAEQPQNKQLPNREQLLLAAYLGKLSAQLGYRLPQIGCVRKFLMLVKYRLFWR